MAGSARDDKECASYGHGTPKMIRLEVRSSWNTSRKLAQDCLMLQRLHMVIMIASTDQCFGAEIFRAREPEGPLFLFGISASLVLPQRPRKQSSRSEPAAYSPSRKLAKG